MCHLSEAKAKAANASSARECSSSSTSQASGTGVKGAALSFSNESQFLLASQSSMDALNAARRARCGDALPVQDIPIDRFRANIVVHGTESFAEDEWEVLCIGDQRFTVVGPCQRCQMVCIDQSTGERSAEPLQTLAHTRRFKV